MENISTKSASDWNSRISQGLARLTLESWDSESECLAKLDIWENAAPTGENRGPVATAIRAACEYRLQNDHVLELREFNISEMPPLPKKITEVKMAVGHIDKLTGDLSQLKTLKLIGCTGFKEMSSKDLKLSNLTNLEIQACHDLEGISVDLEKVSMMKVGGCRNFVNFPAGTPSLYNLELDRNPKLTDFNLHLPELSVLYLSSCPMTDLMHTIAPNLFEAFVSDCPNLTRLSNSIASDAKVYIDNCPKFKG